MPKSLLNDDMFINFLAANYLSTEENQQTNFILS